MQAVKKEDPRIFADRFALMEQVNQVHHARVEDQVKRENLLSPEFWSHVASKIVTGDTIIVRNDSLTYRGELLVIDAGSGYVKVHVLAWHDLVSAKAAEQQSVAGTAEDYSIEFKGPVKLHVVIRKSDGAVLHSGEQRKAGAEAWLKSFLAGATDTEAQAA